MWVFKGGPPDKPGVIFEYHETRAGTAADVFLEKFIGALQSDAYSGYMQFKSSTLIALYLCWAHARRKFSDIVKANKNKPGKAHMAVNFIAKLYAVEKQARENNLNFEQRKKLRKELALPVLNKFKVWLDDSSAVVPSKSPIGEAIGYTLRHWPELTKYIDNGEVEIGRVENWRAHQSGHVSSPRSSNRTCATNASGFRSKYHTFALGTSAMTCAI
jgi:transposase